MRYFHRPGHPRANERGMVSEEDLGAYEEEQYALHSPFMVDRYMEGVSAQDGTDIGSRKKRREYMKIHNLADADDFQKTWEERRKEREAHYTEGGAERDRRERREQLAESYRRVRDGYRPSVHGDIVPKE